MADKTLCNSTGVCFTGICKPGVCGDGVIIASLGEQCDDGNTTSGDGCSSGCKAEDAACADGTRDRLLDAVTYPKIAMCSGLWSGWIGSTGTGSPAALCGKTYHVCTYGDTALMKSISQAIALSPACWAASASNHGSLCQACGINDNKEMAGVGSSCQGKIQNSGTSCIAEAYRIDASEKTCVKNGNSLPWIGGVMCCANNLLPSGRASALIGTHRGCNGFGRARRFDQRRATGQAPRCTRWKFPDLAWWSTRCGD